MKNISKFLVLAFLLGAVAVGFTSCTPTKVDERESTIIQDEEKMVEDDANVTEEENVSEESDEDVIDKKAEEKSELKVIDEESSEG